MKQIVFFLFLFLFSILSFFGSGIIDSQDGLLYLAVARNIYYTGKPTAPIYEYNKYQNIHMNTYLGKDGSTYSPTGLGYSLALIPAVAATDIVYKYLGVSPQIHFPLESDWLILLTASFTNCFFGAVLGVTLFFYFKDILLTTKESLIMVFVSIFATNLWVYTKDSFAHIMFITFLYLSFFLLRKYSQNKKIFVLVISGVSYGISALSYNQTFTLTIIPLAIYYFLLNNKTRPISIKQVITDLFYFIIGFIPLAVIFGMFETIRTPASSSAVFYSEYIQKKLLHPPLSIAIEGLWGQLFSPGRSFFIYSPIVLIILFFWHKIRSSIKPELITLIAFAFISIAFYSIQFSIGKPDQGITGLWHGESSWGPRYLTALIPMAMIVVGHIFQKLNKKARLLFFVPLIIIGVYIEILGILMPYQIKYFDLQDKFFVNSTEYTSFTYSNLLPRYSPILIMSKNLIKLVRNIPNTFKHGEFDVKFYDGIDFPFNVGPERWRVIEGKGFISFNSPRSEPVKTISLGLINQPVDEATNSAILQFTLNNHPLLVEPLVIPLRERKLVDLSIDNRYLKDQDNQLVIDVVYDRPNINTKNFIIPANRTLSLLRSSPQILGMISIAINGKDINKESIDVPYVSQLGPAMTGVTYQNYGGMNKDPWKIWDIHSQIYERVVDFWWVKFFYYWDFPKSVFIVMLLINLTFIFFSLNRLLKFINQIS